MIRSFLTAFSFVFLFVGISGCSADIDDYSKSEHWSLAEYFDGEVTAWGIVQDYRNKLSRKFCVDIKGQWSGDSNKVQSGVLDETFYFDDGSIETRQWIIKQYADGRVTGNANDVVGTAYGQLAKEAFYMRYDLALLVDDTEYQIDIEDWMYPLDEFRVMNQSYLRKFGVEVAKVTIYFDKQSDVSCR